MNAGGDLDNSVGLEGATDGTKIGNSGNKLLTQPNGDLMDGYQPDPSIVVATVNGAKMKFDASNRLEVHQAGSDEGGFRDDFPGASLNVQWTSVSSGTGASVSVASGRVSIVSGTANAGTANISRVGDYLPFTLNFYGKISQRIANQTATFGFADVAASPTIQAIVVWDGTTNTTAKFRTSSGSAATEIQETTFTLPNGKTTANDQTYTISLSANLATLAVNGTAVVQHSLHIPGPYDSMGIFGRIVNAAIVTTTTLSFDYCYLNNWDRLQVDNDFPGEPLLVKTVVGASDTVPSSIARFEPNHQIVIGNAYTQISTGLTIGTAEANVFYMKNNSTSKTVYIFNALAVQDVGNDNNWAIFRLYYNPTVSANGTAATISNMLAGSANTSGCNAFTAPTVTTRGTLAKYWVSGINNVAAVIQDVLFPNYFVLPPAQSLLITGAAKSNGQAMNNLFQWFEV